MTLVIANYFLNMDVKKHKGSNKYSALLSLPFGIMHDIQIQNRVVILNQILEALQSTLGFKHLQVLKEKLGSISTYLLQITLLQLNTFVFHYLYNHFQNCNMMF